MRKNLFVLAALLMAAALITACGSSSDDSALLLLPPGGEKTAPMVSSVSPADGASGVANNVSVAATFSERVNCASITNAAFVVSSGIGNVAGDIECYGAAVLFTPVANLADSTEYTARLTSGVKDLAGNRLNTPQGGVYAWSFTTGTGEDTTAPGVGSSLITDLEGGIINAARNTSIAVIFDEPMNPMLINTTTVLLSDGIGNISGSVEFTLDTVVFRPYGLLLPDTDYTLTILALVEDLAGNPLGTDYTFDFTTDERVYTDAPSVITNSPAHKAVDVDIDMDVSAVFSSTMNPASITSGTFTLVSSKGKVVPGLVSYDPGTDTVTLSPSVRLDGSTLYTATIAGARDMAGQAMAAHAWTFTTELVVTSTSPGWDEPEVLVNSVVTATFSAVMNCATIDDTNFRLWDATATAWVTGTVTCSGDTATFTPDADLNDDASINAEVLDTVEDASGNTMAASYNWYFYTEDLTPPTATLDPGDGSFVVAVSNIVTAAFDEPVLCATVNSTSFTLVDADNADAPVSGTVTCLGTSNAQATFTPDSDLDGSNNYTATVTTDVTDISGNALASDVTSNFKTAMTVVSTNPIDGATFVEVTTVVTATFSDNVCINGVNNTQFTLYDETSGSAVTGSVTSCVAGTATFTPDVELVENHNYTATILATVQDSIDDPMADDHTWNFDTGADSTPPVIGTVTPSDIATATHVDGSFTLTATITDYGSAVTGCEYTKNGGTAWAAATLSGSYPTWTCTQTAISAVDGNVVALNMRGTSTGGTGTGSQISRTGDTTPPNTDHDAPLGWVAGNTWVTLSPTDGRSGVASTWSCIDQANTCTPVSGVTSQQATCTTTNDCTWYVRYYSIDNVGNTETLKSVAVQIDKKVPTGPTSLTTTAQTGNDAGKVQLSWSGAADTGSGLAGYRIAYNSGVAGSGPTAPGNCASNQYYTAASPSTLTLSENTDYAFRVCAQDVVGNYSAGIANAAVTTPTDTVKPTVSSTFPTNSSNLDTVWYMWITINFDEPVLCSTVTASTFTFVGASSGDAGGTYGCNGQSSQFIEYFFPPAGLGADEDYTLTITTGVTDDSGNALNGDGGGGDYTIVFHTAP